MPSVTTFAITLFVIGLLFGFLCYRSWIWNWVDFVYYPVAAFGVALLFLSNTTHRSLLQVDEQLDQNSNALTELRASRPTVDGIPPKILVDSSFNLVVGIVELADACGEVSRMDPTCAVAKKMRSAAADFAAVSTADYETLELQLAATCAAGDQLIAKLSTNEHMSSLVGDELAERFQEARSRPRYYLDYSATERDAKEFERRARDRVAEVRRAITDRSDGMTYVFAVYEAEIKQARTVIHALYPCVAVPRSTIEPLASWSVKRQSKESERARLEELKKRVQFVPAMSRTLQWMQLNLWPFVLIAGLAFKFAKGVATIRKSYRDTKVAK